MIIVNLIRQHPKLKSLIKFGTVGAICVVVDFSVVYILFNKMGINKYAANFSSTTVGIITNYILNRTWTFRSKQPWKKEFVKFVGIGLIGLLLNNLIVYLGTDYIHLFLENLCNQSVDDPFFYCQGIISWSFYMTKAIAIILVFFWNFYINTKYNFKKE